MRRLVTGLMLTGITAAGTWTCGDSTGPGSIAGTYNLVNVGRTYIYEDTSGFLHEKMEMSGYVRLNSDRTYSQGFTFQITEYDSITFELTGRVWTDDVTFSGSWTRAESVIYFTSASGGTFTGSLSGDVLTIGNQVYRK
jgi:hypothetical protein